ncbi:hypothetical protein [Tumebacillus permanentifrigoris]|uniref:Dolichyl-phosphate-mannose-protein mannosyltransferase n=1 Tax=Tumebacillus permanentifrigoris TaxID=378543 RepID=A0A316D4V7_9BACL|nr:hypothetical protein [Tumebacillus permanentifrigoris]PWK07004.1 hypothetical protein C7459_11874 [Tumebacillus permanentifrigoris]
MLKKLSAVEIVALLFIGAVLIGQLLVSPVLGLANNGDFERIMVWGGIKLPDVVTGDAKYFGFFNRVYEIVRTRPGSYISSTSLFLKVAVWINQVFHSTTSFDIRFLGGLHILALLAGVWLIVSGMRKRNVWLAWLTAALLALVTTDKGFTLYFNSMFSEATTFVMVLALIGCALHLTSESEQPQRWALVGATVAGVLFVTAKVQNAVLGFLIVLWLLRFLRLYADRVWKKAVLIAAAVVLVFTAGLSGYNAFDRINIYQTVFYGVLKDSPDPAADLRELGIREDYAKLANTDYFVPHPIDLNSAEFKRDYYDKISRGKVVLFYAKHLDRFWDKLKVCAKSSFNLHYYLGNYENTGEHKALEQSQTWTQWTEFVSRVLPKSLWFLIAFCVAFAGGSIWEWRRAASLRGKLLVEFFLVIEVMAMAQYVLPILGDGEADLGKHLFLFNLLGSVMLVTSMIWLVRRFLYGRK